MSDIREALAHIKERYEECTTCEPCALASARRVDADRMHAALTAVLEHADRDDRPHPMPRSYTVATSVMAKSQERAQIKKLIRDALEANDDDQ